MQPFQLPPGSSRSRSFPGWESLCYNALATLAITVMLWSYNVRQFSIFLLLSECFFNISVALSQTLTPLIADHLAVTKQEAKAQTGSEAYLGNVLPTHDQSSSAGRRLHIVPAVYSN